MIDDNFPYFGLLRREMWLLLNGKEKIRYPQLLIIHSLIILKKSKANYLFLDTRDHSKMTSRQKCQVLDPPPPYVTVSHFFH